MTDTLPSPPPSEVETSPHHDIPPEIGFEERIAILVGRVIDDKLKTHLEPLLNLVGVVEQLRGSLDLAVDEMRRQNNARKGEIQEQEGRINGHDRQLSDHDREILELRNALSVERKRIDALESEIDRWVLAGGTTS